MSNTGECEQNVNNLSVYSDFRLLSISSFVHAATSREVLLCFEHLSKSISTNIKASYVLFLTNMIIITYVCTNCIIWIWDILIMFILSVKHLIISIRISLVGFWLVVLVAQFWENIQTFYSWIRFLYKIHAEIKFLFS